MSVNSKRDRRAYWQQYYRNNKERLATKDAARDREQKFEQYRDKVRPEINALKDKPCADCTFTYPYFIMDFDHVRGTKVANISRMVSQGVSLDKIRVEIAKW